MSRKQRITFILILLTALTSPFINIFSETNTISGIKIFNLKNKAFGPISRIQIRDGRITAIQPEPSEVKPLFAIPPFCDASTTLGANSLGGENRIQEIKIALDAFLQHGFFYIHSSGDGHWVSMLDRDIEKGKLSGPRIINSGKPILVQSSESEKVSPHNYFIAKTAEKLELEVLSRLKQSNNTIHLLYRYNEVENFHLESRLLNRLQLTATNKKARLVLSTYGDHSSILDSLEGGVKTLFHPIPYSIKNVLLPAHYNGLVWSPQFVVYYFLHRQGNSILKEDLDWMKMKSKYFQINYARDMESFLEKSYISEEEKTQAGKEYQSYLKFFMESPSLYKRIILSSGSGNYLTFPGISGWQEMKILNQAIKNPLEIIQIASGDTCGFLGKNTEIGVNQSADFLLLSGDPTNDLENLFRIEEIYLQGRRMKNKSVKENPKVKPVLKKGKKKR